MSTHSRAPLCLHKRILFSLNTTSRIKKGIGHVAKIAMRDLPYYLQSSEQLVPQEMLATALEKPETDFQLQYAPGWIIDKGIEDEKENYENAKAYQRLTLTAFREMQM